MRKLLKIVTGIALAMVWGVSAVQFIAPGGVAGVTSSIASRLGGTEYVELADESVPLSGPSTDGPAQNGWLQVREGILTNAAGEPFQLQGMSSHGLAWFPQYTQSAAIATTKSFGANLFRVAMYVDDTPGNYTTDAADQESNTNAMITAIDNALALDMYVIADWHIMEDGNPMNRVECAVAFFDALSAKYADEPGVLYEICNEPNGEGTWEVISAYADEVIPVIRANAPEALILVGTPEYSSDLMSPLREPLAHDNIMYAYHYYSNAADKSYDAVLEDAREASLPVFVTEWGMGSGETPASEQEQQRAAEFLAYLQEHGISWANWSLCNKNESFSAILPNVFRVSGWTDEDLTASGKLVFGALRQ